ncbi:MAG: hypothetical protein JRI89_16595 [Deltaproteobacteria bacterium]|nr:hypothetical protein [Deltaproteobacteria bacterium]
MDPLMGYHYSEAFPLAFFAPFREPTSVSLSSHDNDSTQQFLNLWIKRAQGIGRWAWSIGFSFIGYQFKSSRAERLIVETAAIIAN